MRVSVETVIDAPRKLVFERVMDIEGWPEVVSAITKTEILGTGPIGVGTVFRETRMIFGNLASEDMTIAELVPHRKIVLTAENHGALYRSEHAFTDKDGGTHLELVFEGQPISVVARMMAPVSWAMLGPMRKVLADDLSDLKASIEGTVDGAGGGLG